MPRCGSNNVDQFNMKKAGEVMQAYKEEQIVPYLDKYRMAKWANDAGIHYALDAAPTVDTIAQTIIKARNQQRNRRVTGKTALIIPYQYLDVLSLSSQWVKLEKLGGQVLTKCTMGQFYGMDVVPFIDELMPENAQFMFINPKANIAPNCIEWIFPTGQSLCTYTLQTGLTKTVSAGRLFTRFPKI